MAPYVLVVESDTGLQRLIADTLREANYELAVEREAKWAERSLLVRPPDALIVDTRLEDGTGFKVATALRKDPDTRGVPILFVASHYRGQAHAVEARRRFHPAEYLQTPFDANTLLACLLRKVPPPPPSERASSASAVPAAPVDAAQAAEARGVERQARKLTEAREAPAIKGQLSRQSFAQVLRRLYSGRRSGALLVTKDSTKKIVYFRDGYPVSVRSNVLEECLGQLLVSQRRITLDELNESLSQMKAKKRQQGDVLIEMGLLSPHALERALVEQMERKLYDIFAWTDGTFAFRDEVKVPGDAINLERPTAALILEGVRRHYTPDRQEMVLSAFSGRFPVPTADPLMQLQDITQDANELRFVEGIDGTQMLEAILNVPPIPKERARILLCAMIEAGMLQASDEPVAAPVMARARRGTPPPPAGGKDEAELGALLEAMRGQTHFEVLGVPIEANLTEIESAYVRLAREFHPDGYRAREAPVRQLVAQLFERIGEARTVLRDETRRKAYVRRLARARSVHGASDKAMRAAERGYYVAVEHLRARRFSQAVAALQSAIALVPAQANYHVTLGWALYRQAPADPDAVARARAELEHAVMLDEQDPWLHVSLGRFLSETGDVDGAIGALTAALRLQPQLPEIEQEVRRLRGAAR